MSSWDLADSDTDELTIVVGSCLAEASATPVVEDHCALDEPNGLELSDDEADDEDGEGDAEKDEAQAAGQEVEA